MRTPSLFLGLVALAGAGVVACGGANTTSSVDPSSDGGLDSGLDATAIDADAASVDAGADALPDGADAASPDAADADVTDAPDANVADAADAADASPLPPVSVLLAPGTQVFGVTSDDYVVYWVKNDDVEAGHHPTEGVVAAVPAAGGTPQILSTTVAIEYPYMNVVVAGATVVWLDDAGVDPAGCPRVGHALRSWSSAHGVSQIAAYAVGNYIESPNGEPLSANQTLAYVNADGSRIAYAPGCIATASGTALTTIALAATDGTSAPLTATLNPARQSAWPYVTGTTLSLFESPPLVYSGNPLTLVPNMPDGVRDPTGAWGWERGATGAELVLASNGTAVFTDPSANGPFQAEFVDNLSHVFDATGTNLFYLSSDGVKQLSLASPIAARTLPGSAGITGLLDAAPNGQAVLGKTTSPAGEVTYQVVTTGAASATFTIPSTTGGLFLPDSTLIWSDHETLFAEPVLGGPVATIATGIYFFTRVGGSQIAASNNAGGISSTSIVDATGKLPTFALNPSPYNSQVFAPPAGGLVAYASAGGIYAVHTR